jgi:hypothetical protein
VKWYYNVWFVLFLLLFVLGPFALPLVWKNPRFSSTVKLLLTVLAVGYTVVLFVMTARMIQAVQSSLDPAVLSRNLQDDLAAGVAGSGADHASPFPLRQLDCEVPHPRRLRHGSAPSAPW